MLEPQSPRLGPMFGEVKHDSSGSPPKHGAAMIQAAFSENTPHNKASAELNRTKDAQRNGDRKSADKSKEKGSEKSRDHVGHEKDVKSQQMAQPWRHGGEGDKIRVQSRLVKKH